MAAKINPEDIAKQVHGEDLYINNAEMEGMLAQYNESREEDVDMDTFIDHMEQNAE